MTKIDVQADQSNKVAIWVNQWLLFSIGKNKRRYLHILVVCDKLFVSAGISLLSEFCVSENVKITS